MSFFRGCKIIWLQFKVEQEFPWEVKKKRREHYSFIWSSVLQLIFLPLKMSGWFYWTVWLSLSCSAEGITVCHTHFLSVVLWSEAREHCCRRFTCNVRVPLWTRCSTCWLHICTVFWGWMSAMQVSLTDFALCWILFQGKGTRFQR